MLPAVAENTLDIYRFCHIAYDKPTHLKFFGHTILLQEGAQQGDPLGSLVFCLSIHSLSLSSKSHLKVAYMDDITLGGSLHAVATDVTMIKTKGALKGLILNEKKCEAITQESQTIDRASTICSSNTDQIYAS